MRTSKQIPSLKNFVFVLIITILCKSYAVNHEERRSNAVGTFESVTNRPFRNSIGSKVPRFIHILGIRKYLIRRMHPHVNGTIKGLFVKHQTRSLQRCCKHPQIHCPNFTESSSCVRLHFVSTRMIFEGVSNVFRRDFLQSQSTLLLVHVRIGCLLQFRFFCREESRCMAVDHVIGHEDSVCFKEAPATIAKGLAVMKCKLIRSEEICEQFEMCAWYETFLFLPFQDF